MAHTNKLEFHRPDGMHIQGRIANKADRRAARLLVRALTIDPELAEEGKDA